MRAQTYRAGPAHSGQSNNNNMKKKNYPLPDFRFSGGLMTRDFERLTLKDLRLTSRKKVVARSCIR